MPLNGSPKRRPASTSDVASAPAIAAARAAPSAASTPWSRRAEKSTNARPWHALHGAGTDDVQREGLEQLCFDDGSRDLHDRLAGEHDLAFVDSAEVAAELEARHAAQEVFLELPERP